jgi:AraC-like DNA-binding protein
MLPQLHAAHPRSDRHGTATLGWMSCPVAATRETVQRIVTTLLPDGSPDIQTVAAIARLSVRTRQRRLHDQGVTFAWVVAGARLTMAQQMLVDPARKVIDVVLDLGYSDPAHFTRAFVRWTGLTPREFRRLRSTECGDKLTLTVELRKLTADGENLLREQGKRQNKGKRIARRRNRAIAPRSGRKSGHALDDVEPRDVSGWRALSAQPAMRVGQLSEWNVPGRSEAPAPLGCAVPAERAMRQWQAGERGCPPPDAAWCACGGRTGRPDAAVNLTLLCSVETAKRSPGAA